MYVRTQIHGQEMCKSRMQICMIKTLISPSFRILCRTGLDFGFVYFPSSEKQVHRFLDKLWSVYHDHSQCTESYFYFIIWCKSKTGTVSVSLVYLFKAWKRHCGFGFFHRNLKVRGLFVHFDQCVNWHMAKTCHFLVQHAFILVSALQWLNG